MVARLRGYGIKNRLPILYKATVDVVLCGKIENKINN
jgi:hypothetical protein